MPRTLISRSRLFRLPSYPSIIRQGSSRWQSIATIWLLFMGAALCAGQSIDLSVTDLRQSIDMMGGDIERNSKAIQHAANKDEILEWGFRDIAFNVCRVQYDKNQELVEGEKNWAFYNKQVTTMQAIRALNPDILFFATLRSDYDGYGNDNNLPDWCCNYATKTVDAEKYGVFLADYVEYMAEQEVPISMLSVAKEWTTFVTAPVARDVIHKLKSELDAREVPVPLISDQGFWSTAQGNKYIDQVRDLGTEDLYWSFCNHNYGTDDDTLWEGISENAASLGKPLYNDESSHGGGGPTFGEERPIGTPIAAYVEKCHMYAAGVKGEIFFELWSRGINRETRPIYYTWGGTGRKLRAYYIMKHFANEVKDSCYLPSSLQGLEGVHAMAFRKNDEVIFWAINEGEVEHSSVPLAIDAAFTSATAEGLVWTEEGAIEGVGQSITIDGSTFAMTIPARSLSCYRFSVTEAAPQSLPYKESFEDGFAGWRQSTDDDYDWSRSTFGTSTVGTGPSSASDGNWYLYAEGHEAGAPDLTTMLECPFDLSNVAGARFGFDYHLYGPDIDYLALDVHDGSAWTEGVWTQQGAQHESSEAPWSRAVVDLSAYAGLPRVTLRFRSKKMTWHASDVAIDNLVLEEPPQRLPYGEDFEDGFGAWVQSVDDDIDWSRHSGGTETANTGPSAASGGDWYLYVENHSRGTYYKTAAVECAFDFSGVLQPVMTFDYHMYGPYIDFLAVDVFDGAAWSLDVYQLSRAQHASSEEAWSTATVDLSPFAGLDEVLIRFRSKQLQWHAADAAIDSINIEEAASPYEQWASLAFAAGEDGVDTGALGNADGDHFTNEEEWALLLDPTQPDEPVLVCKEDGDDFTVRYQRRAGSGASVHAVWSPSLHGDAWQGPGAGLTETVLETDGDVEWVEARVALEEGCKFIRLVVE
ncbi:MAG: hypothetical protein Q7Q71_12170 [Verrucomicrobiota bacterium JB023]|nr:hypothetical protein [Verrucomicrobiota bacterium JB023]